MVQPNAPVEIYKLHLLLLQISPPIWRRLHVRSNSSIATLHDLRQIAFDWSDFHLHRFVIRGKEYGVSRMGCTTFTTDARKVLLSQFRFRVNERFLYEYDFGDLWQHQIRLEGVQPEMILLAVGWYLRFSLSYRDVEELLAERGLRADHVTVWRWVQRYAPELERRLRSRLNSTNDSWRVDETYIRVKGKWVYLYRAVDSTGATIDFLLSARRDTPAAKRFLAKALGGANHPHPRVINTDKEAAYPPAIVQLKAKGALVENCQHRPVQYLNNVLEQDHRAIKRRVRASQHFRSFWGAWRTIAGYEAIHMIRKGQACWSAVGAKVGLLHRFILDLFAATS